MYVYAYLDPLGIIYGYGQVHPKPSHPGIMFRTFLVPRKLGSACQPAMDSKTQKFIFEDRVLKTETACGVTRPFDLSELKLFPFTFFCQYINLNYIYVQCLPTLSLEDFLNPWLLEGKRLDRIRKDSQLDITFFLLCPNWVWALDLNKQAHCRKACV